MKKQRNNIPWRKILASSFICLLVLMISLNLLQNYPTIILKQTDQTSWTYFGDLDTPQDLQDKSIRTKIRNKTAIDLMILAYHRSGSTFTADVIQRSSAVFYLYEPLRGFSGDYYYTNDMYCTNEICRYPNSWRSDPTVVLKDLSNIYSCKTEKLHAEVIKELENTAKSSKDQSFMKTCMKTELKKKCLNQLNDRCDKAQVRLIKTIRVSFKMAVELLETLPNLKILHLLRDPRGMFLSKNAKKSEKQTDSQMKSYFHDGCMRVLSDVVISEKLQKRYKGRIKTLHYEDIATFPFESLRDIYNFIGISLTKDIESYVHLNTMAGKNDTGYYGTQRRNSTETAYKWKKKLPLKEKLLIENECKALLDKMKNYSDKTHTKYSNTVQ